MLAWLDGVHGAIGVGLDNQVSLVRLEHRIFHSSPSEPFPAGSSTGTLVVSSSGGAMSVPRLRESGGAFVLMAGFHRNVWTRAIQDPASTRKPFRIPAASSRTEMGVPLWELRSTPRTDTSGVACKRLNHWRRNRHHKSTSEAVFSVPNFGTLHLAKFYRPFSEVSETLRRKFTA